MYILKTSEDISGVPVFINSMQEKQNKLTVIFLYISTFYTSYEPKINGSRDTIIEDKLMLDLGNFSAFILIIIDQFLLIQRLNETLLNYSPNMSHRTSIVFFFHYVSENLILAFDSRKGKSLILNKDVNLCAE
jgi:hypothetical protein